MRIINVCFILDYHTIGGATHSFLEMVVGLKELGVCPIVCLGRKTDITTILDKNQIDYIIIGHRPVMEPFVFKGKRWPLRFLSAFFRFWKNENNALSRLKKIDWTSFDIIHTNSARDDIGCYINKKYKTPHIMHIREFADSDFDCISFRFNYVSFYNKYTTKYISISNAVKCHWVDKGIKEEKVATIYNGIHYEDVTISSDDDKKASDIHMFIAGGVYPTKGQHLAIEAIGQLPEDIRNHVFIDVAGWYSEEYVKMMKDYALSLGYLKQVNFLGSINDVHERIGKYQIGLMCSRAEGFGRVTAEYMHGRLGVIASDSGANPELIEDGVTGLLFKSGDVQSLADCILKYYNDRELLIRLSNAAQKKARAIYTQQKNAESIYELYKQILQKND